MFYWHIIRLSCKAVCHGRNTEFKGSSSTYTIQARGWLIITMKDNKTIDCIEIVFLKNESRTMIIFVSDLFLKANQKT